MEFFFILFVLYLFFKSVDPFSWLDDAVEDRKQNKDIEKQRKQLERETQRQNAQRQFQRTVQEQKAREHQRQKSAYLVKALVQLTKSPDFQRCQSIAAQCTSLPRAYRVGLFKKYRPRLVLHFRNCLRRGLSGQVLLSQLAELVQSLGVAPFEASYIARELQSKRQVTRRPSLTFAQQLEALRRDHEQRVAAIEATVTDEELRDQLVETEQTRFQEAMFNLQTSTQPEGGQE